MKFSRLLTTIGKVTAAVAVGFAVRRRRRRRTEIEEEVVEVEVGAVGEREEVRAVEVVIDGENELEDVVVKEEEQDMVERVEKDEDRDGACDVVEMVVNEREAVEAVRDRECDGIVIARHGVVHPPVIFNRENYYRVDHGYIIPVEGQWRSFVDGWEPRVFYGGPMLGQGSFGSVGICEDEYGYICALKTLEYRDEYEVASKSALVHQEVELQARCAGSHIVGAYGFWETEYEANMAFEFMPFGSVEDNVFQGSDVEGVAVSERRAASAVRQVALALATCHFRGVAHCDLKMANILIGGDGVLKLSDFGLAVELDDDDKKTDVRSFEPQFAAPELRGRGRYGTAVDMWSLGILMYELLTGTRRWHLAVCTTGRDYIPGIDSFSEDARDLLRRLLSEDEEGRPSATDVVVDQWIVRNDR